jgi:hypothetical protein
VSGTVQAHPVTRALLRDGSLAVRAEARAWPAVAAWMPRIPPAEPGPGQARAWIHAEHGPPTFVPPSTRPVIELCGVAGWAQPSGRVLLCEPGHAVSAVVDPPAGHAAVRLQVPAEPTEELRVAAFAGLTLAAAFLLGRLGRTLVHAGAVVAPDGRAWLLAGGTFSGKSTTCLNLMHAGWHYLADDHVVLAAAGDGVEVEGWPRRFNLDRGYASGVSQGVRSRVDAEALVPGRWLRAAPLAGVLFPRVQAELATALSRASAPESLSGLLQQSPWLLADPGTAPEVLALLQRAARLPAYALRLGADSYRGGEHLAHVLHPVVAAPQLT